MRKTFAVLISLLLAGGMLSCSFFLSTGTTTTTEAPSSTTTGTVSSSVTGLPSTSDSGTTTTVSSTTVTEPVTTETPTTGTTTAASPTETVPTTTTEGTDPFRPVGYSLLQDELPTVGIPSSGEIRILVFVVDFPDATLSGSGIGLSSIETAFNGEAADTAYESLRSYYLESSFGALSLTADVYGTYRAEHYVSWYEEDYLENYTESDLLHEVLQSYDAQIDYSDYDANGDGAIDGVYLLYTAPVSYEAGSDLWWAWQTNYEYADVDFFDGVSADYLVWAGTDFLLEGDEGINSRTLIHETGHLLGLDDYYDYDDSDDWNSMGLGGADMMDATYGDHGPISKILLGWITPLVVTGSAAIDLSPYAEAGETLLLIDEWNGTIFDEYLLVIFYTPEGLNEQDSLYWFTTPGIIVYHVDARIGDGYLEDSSYYTIFNFNNTDTKHKFVQILEADRDSTIESTGWTENEDLFEPGDSLGAGSAYPLAWYQTDRNPLDFVLTVGTLGETASLTVVFPE